MARREPGKKKEHRSKRRQPADPSPSIRRPIHVVLWKEPPKDDAQENMEDEEETHEFDVCASTPKLEARRVRKVDSLETFWSRDQWSR